MKHGSLALFLALGVAACEGHPSGHAEAGVEADAGAADAVIAIERAPADSGVADGATDAGGDAAVSPDVSTADAGTSDVPSDAAPDAASADAAGDSAPDALAATCGPGASREMLCTSYCDGMGKFCTGANAQYPSTDACRSACLGPAWACGKTGETTGNSLFCRLAHMALAGVGAAEKECPNAGSSSPVCQ